MWRNKFHDALSSSLGDRCVHNDGSTTKQVLARKKKGLPGAVGDLDADAIAMLASALGGRVIAGSRPTQAGTRAAPAAVAVGAHGPAGPGSEAPVHGNVSYLRAAGKRKAF